MLVNVGVRRALRENLPVFMVGALAQRAARMLEHAVLGAELVSHDGVVKRRQYVFAGEQREHQRCQHVELVAQGTERATGTSLHGGEWSTAGRTPQPAPRRQLARATFVTENSRKLPL